MKETPRRRTRLFALQILFSREQLGPSPARETMLAGEYKLKEDNIGTAKSIANYTWNNKGDIDELIQSHLENWTQDRLLASLNTLMRMGVAELKFFPDVDAKVAITEAVSICRSHVDPDAAKLLNGVLHKIAVKLGRIS